MVANIFSLFLYNGARSVAYHGGVNKLQKVLCLLTAQAQRHRWKSDPNSGAFTTNEPNLMPTGTIGHGTRSKGMKRSTLRVRGQMARSH